MDFKHEKDMLLFTSLHPLLIMIYADLNWYARSRHFIDLTITETITTADEDKAIGRVSNSHQLGISVDIRTRDIDPFIVSDLIEYINNKPEYKRFHYLAFSGEKRLAFLHTHRGEHIHLQIHKTFGTKSE